jgi:cytosine/adenosine deaminase-related metal-dependent hydrolase
MKLIRARTVFSHTRPHIENGAVIIKDGKIAAVGPYQDLASSLAVEEQIDLGEQILLPGLINAHCHLDYTSMRGKIPFEKVFARWLQAIRALKEGHTNEDYLKAISDGLKELRQWGVTSVFNIGSIIEIMSGLPTPDLRTWWFYELMDIRANICLEDFVLRMLAFSEKQVSWLGGFGLSPHAPYTSSHRLYRDVKFCAQKYDIPVTTHLAETPEELEMFRNGSGHLFDFLKSAGRNMRDCGTKSPVAILLGEGFLPRGSLLAHLNAVDPADWGILQRHAPDFTVVHCPKTHAYFQREKFHFDQLKQCGVTVCLGTDSLASNSSLNLFEEMRVFAQSHNTVPEKELLNMVTVYPAKAIGLARRLGTIEVGAFADLIAIPYSGSRDEVDGAIIAHTDPILWMMVQGRTLNSYLKY